MKNLLIYIFSFLAILLVFQTQIIAECRIGFLIPITGEYASAGEECSFGQSIAAERHQDKNLPIKFIREDSRAQGKDSVTHFKKFIEADQVDAVELIRSPVGMAVNPLSKSAKLPIVGAIGHPEYLKNNPYAFQFWPSTDDESKVLVQAMMADGNTVAYSIATEDDWLLAFQSDFNKNTKALNGKIAASENVEPSFVDFRSLILKIKKANVDAIFIGFGPNQLNIFIKQFREAGLTQKLYSTFNVKSQDVIKVLPKELLEQITFVEVDSSKPFFLEKYAKLSNGKIPSAVSYSCYLSTEALYQACSEHLLTGKEFQEILMAMSTIYTYDQAVSLIDRKAKFEIAVKDFKNGEVVSR